MNSDNRLWKDVSMLVRANRNAVLANVANADEPPSEAEFLAVHCLLGWHSGHCGHRHIFGLYQP